MDYDYDAIAKELQIKLKGGGKERGLLTREIAVILRDHFPPQAKSEQNARALDDEQIDRALDWARSGGDDDSPSSVLADAVQILRARLSRPADAALRELIESADAMADSMPIPEDYAVAIGRYRRARAALASSPREDAAINAAQSADREWILDRYHNGVCMAEGARVHAASFDEAVKKAKKLFHETDFRNDNFKERPATPYDRPDMREDDKEVSE